MKVITSLQNQRNSIVNIIINESGASIEEGSSLKINDDFDIEVTAPEQVEQAIGAVEEA